jgi:hypothetical protein
MIANVTPLNLRNAAFIRSPFKLNSSAFLSVFYASAFVEKTKSPNLTCRMFYTTSL